MKMEDNERPPPKTDFPLIYTLGDFEIQNQYTIKMKNVPVGFGGLISQYTCHNMSGGMSSLRVTFD